ncbi:DUF4352 domain-containing protein [Listeria kieliensis]|uniref:DUF4352 domain-containing protein n=1 Tax=Listeria kieliensis TaxID=1621700 RepID=A0A3D8TL29_9LIST|nr:DUF4352 domain-containing protein [Listeria kieliensis]RDW99447.1 hypothetical protein UR08_11490 [Listeria kieliensis]
MKKVGLIISLMLILFISVACGEQTQSKDIENKKTKSWEILPTKIEVKKSSEKGKKELVISYKAKNISKKEQGIVAADFFLSDNDEHYFYAKGSLKNINEVVRPGKEVRGKGYYIIADDLKKADLTYSPVNTTERVVWKNLSF